MSDKNIEPTTKGGLPAIIMVIFIIIIIYKGCFSSSKYADSGMVVDTSFNNDVAIIKAGAITKEDSRINIYNGRNEYPKEDDVIFAVRFYMSDITGAGSDIRFTDSTTFAYISETKVYRTVGTVMYKNSKGKNIRRDFRLGLNYLGGYPLKKNSWKVAFFK